MQTTKRRTRSQQAIYNRVPTAVIEEVQHHPDILIRYAKVTLTLSTHDAGGLSEKDFAFAADCDRLYAG